MRPPPRAGAMRLAAEGLFSGFVSKKSMAIAMLVLSTILIGSGNVPQITALQSIGPFTVVMFRSTLAVLVLTPFAILELRRNYGWPPHIGFCVAAAVIYFASSIIIQQIAAQTTTATNIGFLINMSAVFVPMMTWIMVREKPPLIVWPASIVAVVGAYLVTGAGHMSATLGDALCLLAGLLDAVWIIALSYVMPKCKAPATLLAITYGVTSLMATVGMAFEPLDPLSLWDALPEIAWLGGITSAAGFLLSTKAQEHLPACVVGVLFCFEAIVSAVLGNLFLGEKLGPIEATGAVMIVTSVALLQVNDSAIRRLLGWLTGASLQPNVPELSWPLSLPEDAW